MLTPTLVISKASQLYRSVRRLDFLLRTTAAPSFRVDMTTYRQPRGTIVLSSGGRNLWQHPGIMFTGLRSRSRRQNSAYWPSVELQLSRVPGRRHGSFHIPTDEKKSPRGGKNTKRHPDDICWTAHRKSRFSSTVVHLRSWAWRSNAGELKAEASPSLASSPPPCIALDDAGQHEVRLPSLMGRGV